MWRADQDVQYWIFKVADQQIYADSPGQTYMFDNTHSVRVKGGDRFVYLSTKGNRYEFLGHGRIREIERRAPVGTERRNDRVKNVYIAHLMDMVWFAEPLDFLPRSPNGRIHRRVVGVENALPWGISMPRINADVFSRILELAQPAVTHSLDHSSDERTETARRKRNTLGQTIELGQAVAAAHFTLDQDIEPANFQDARERVTRALIIRRGQPEFRRRLIQAYDGRCAVTGCDVLDVLEAAHIHPYRGPATNHVQNGILLRTDIHTLFDVGLITINTHDMSVRCHSTLRESIYADLHSRHLVLPYQVMDHPNKVLLDWHCEWWRQRNNEPLANVSLKSPSP